MTRLYALSLFCGLVGLEASAQCTPTFLNGCFSWQNQSINIGSIAWTAGVDCYASDYTDMSTVVEAGDVVPVNVVSGNWCGCAVWIDLDNNGDFTEAENFFYNYGGSEVHTYDFNITVPEGTPDGLYVLRVVAGWGTDCFSPSDNGYGACGDYQYGNFTDLTLDVGGVIGMDEMSAAPVAVLASANPTAGQVLLTADARAPLERVTVRGLDGRVLQVAPFASRVGQVEVDLSGLPAGAYLLECSAREARSTIKVVKH
jgi:hypothetical protein